MASTQEINFLLYSPIDQWKIEDPITLSPSDFQVKDLSKVKIGQLPCQYPDCPSAIAWFNYPGSYPGLYCREHKKLGMVNVRFEICTQPGCQAKASFNYPNQRKGTLCEIHKLPKMVKLLQDNRCRYGTCRKRALFNYTDQDNWKDTLYPRLSEDNRKGTLCPILCEIHRLANMTNVTHYNRCQFQDCRKRALFNYPGHPDQSKGILCLIHKKDNMRLIPGLKCKKFECTQTPSYASPYKNTYLYCLKHRKGGSINISDRRCQNYRCQRMATYGYAGTKKPLFCSGHRRKEMVHK